MSRRGKSSKPSKHPAALAKLAADLAAFNLIRGQAPADEDMLSLIINDALNGEDVAERYPALYQKLLQNAELREAFLDALAAIEADRAGNLVPLPKPPRSGVDFLHRALPVHSLERLERGGWRASWEKTARQLQPIFSPHELAYRSSDAGLNEETWFTLLRGEVQVDGCIYAVVLECTLANGAQEALSAFVMLAVVQAADTSRPAFPLQASLRWGGYEASVLITEEGRTRFPDIPLGILMDSADQEVETGLSLTLENAA